MGHVGDVVEWRFPDIERHILFVIKGTDVVRFSEVVPRDDLDVVWLVIQRDHLLPAVEP